MPSTGGQEPGPTIHNPAHTGHYDYERRQRELRQERAAKVAGSGDADDREASDVAGVSTSGGGQPLTDVPVTGIATSPDPALSVEARE